MGALPRYNARLLLPWRPGSTEQELANLGNGRLTDEFLPPVPNMSQAYKDLHDKLASQVVKTVRLHLTILPTATLTEHLLCSSEGPKCACSLFPLFRGQIPGTCPIFSTSCPQWWVNTF